MANDPTNDLLKETLITFPGLAKQLPPQRKGRPVHVSTIHRWRHPGIHGVKLAAIRIGGAWATSFEAFSRFCAQLTAIKRGTKIPSATTAAAEADATLDQQGW